MKYPFIAIIVLLAGTAGAGTYSGGEGTEAHPYQISTVEDWLELIDATDDWDKHFVLMNDIDFGGAVIAPVASGIMAANWGFQGILFTGVFSGGRWCISNVVINQPDSDFVGLFGGIGSGGEVYNLRLHNIELVGKNSVGGLCGLNSGKLIQCFSTESRVTGHLGVGGLCGTNLGFIGQSSSSGSVTTVHGGEMLGGMVGTNYATGVIVDCSSNVAIVIEDVSSQWWEPETGGFVGSNRGIIQRSHSAGYIIFCNIEYEYLAVGGFAGLHGGPAGILEECYSKVDIHCGDTGVEIGGLVGYHKSGSITSCYATGSVAGEMLVGGLVGDNNGGEIFNSYSTGGVTGIDMVGGLVGQNSEGTITGSFWDMDASAQANSSGGIGKTTAEMLTPATFIDAGWDHVNIWKLLTGSYPRLSWEDGDDSVSTVDLNDDGSVDMFDFALLAQQWLRDDCQAPDWCENADIDRSGDVGLPDLSILSESWAGDAPGDMVLIPAGTFQMGDNMDGVLMAQPVHTVTLSSFYISKYETTNAKYCQFLNSARAQGLITVTHGIVYKSGSGTSFRYCDTSTYGSWSQISFSNNTFTVRTKGGRSMSNDPMVHVSWYGSVAYCNWRSQQDGLQPCYNLSTWACDFSKNGYHLPTEAQWEYAARGGLSGRRFPWGDTITHSQANYWSSSSHTYDTSPTGDYHPTWNDGIMPYTSVVGSFAPNGYGLYDMAGNVWEWCNDWYGSYGSIPQNNPTGPTTGSWRILRGGSWYYFADYCRVAYRGSSTPDYRGFEGGFRVCR